MSIYRDRAPRVDVTFPLEFITGEERVFGVCENLSESGLLARFSVELEIWVDGEVDLHFGTDLLGVKVRVARVIGSRAGLAFHFTGEHQRQKVRELIESTQKKGLLPQNL